MRRRIACAEQRPAKGRGTVLDKTIGRIVRVGKAIVRLPDLQRRQEFLLNEVRRLNEQIRAMKAGEDLDQRQTKSSFDYQWHEMPEGRDLPSDPAFLRLAGQRVCEMTGLAPEWFQGKRVVDIGSGIGRFSFPMLEMGAMVPACDQSDWALRRTQSLCTGFGERVRTRQVDLLGWDERMDFDLAFSYGVVHHTGNTYLAIRNVARKVRDGGCLFLMVYGLPEEPGDFTELNTYERLRQELRNLPMGEKQRILVERFGPDAAHGYFDAVSPRINDLLTFEEIAELLAGIGFVNICRSVAGRNIHLSAEKPEK